MEKNLLKKMINTEALTRTQWVRNKIAEFGLEGKLIKSFFKEYQKIFEGSPYSSFKIMVNSEIRNIKKEINNLSTIEKKNLIKNKETKKQKINYKKYDKAKLLNFLYTWIKEKQQPLSIDGLIELSEKNKINYKNWFEIFGNNLTQILEDIYKELFETLSHKREVFELKEEVKKLNKERVKLVEDYTLEEKILENLKEVVIEYKPLKCNINLNKKSQNKETLLFVSDSHYEEQVDPAQILYLNKYDPIVAQNRLERVFEETIEYSTTLKSDILNIYILGDMVNGLIHEDLRENASMSISKSVLQLVDMLGQLIVKSKKYFKSIKIVSVVGNHSRFDTKIRYTGYVENNFEYMLYEFLKKELKNVVDKFENPVSKFWIDNILGHNFYITHGDDFKGGFGFSPVPNTASRDVAKISAMFRQRKLKDPIDIHYFCIAHFHTSTESISFDGIPILFNGSLIGSSPFSVNKIKRAAMPAQNVYIVNKENGIIDRHIVNLSKVF